MKFTDTYLIENGKSRYTIIYSGQGDSLSILAVRELRKFFEQASGIRLPLSVDTEWNNKSDEKFLSVGNTSLFKKTCFGEKLTSLKETGVAIFEKDGNVFMTGISGYGILNSVYEFLRLQFSFESYYLDENYIETNVKNKKLLAFDYLYNPDITYAISSYGEAERFEIYRRRLKMMNMSRELFGYMQGDVHNSLRVVPYSKYGKEHPEWYYLSEDGSPVQLCYSRDVDGLSDVVLESIKKAVTEELTNRIAFTQEDGATWCDCPKCREIREKYGTDSATLIKFMNVLADKTSKWQKEAGIKDKITITFFAYDRTTEPPVIKDKDGRYMPVDESVILRDNLNVYYAPISMEDFYDFSYPSNQVYAEYFKKWNAISDSIYTWLYSAYFVDNYTPIYTFNAMQNQYKFLAEHGVSAIYQQELYNQGPSTDWSRLKMYVESKLMWDTKVDLEKIIMDWFENYFRIAFKSMYEFFDDERKWYCECVKKYDINGNYMKKGRAFITHKEFWPVEKINYWESLIKKALKEIEIYKENQSELYCKIKERINLERLSLLKLKWFLYRDNLTENEYMECAGDFLYYCGKEGGQLYDVGGCPTRIIFDKYNSGFLNLDFFRKT